MSEEPIKTECDKPEELDVGCERFDPLRALYAPNYKVTEKTPKVLYQNIAALESALVKVGVWQLNKRPKANNATELAKGKKHATSIISEPVTARRFEAHQMPVEGIIKTKHQRNLFTHMAGTEGPLATLQNHLPAVEKEHNRLRLRVYLRKQSGLGGSIEGDLVAYDKQWNLLLRNAVQTWQRRKYKYGEQKICGEPAPEECSARLSQMGIKLPELQVKSLNRKNVQLRRELPQLMVRGEHVVLITFISSSENL